MMTVLALVFHTHISLLSDDIRGGVYLHTALSTVCLLLVDGTDFVGESVAARERRLSK